MEQSQPKSFTKESQLPGLGMLLVGHGTRDSAGLAEFRELHRSLVEQAETLPVEACFLELAEPNIVAGLEALLARGVRKIVVAPLLLFAAGHAKRDIPEGVAEALDKLSETNEAARSSEIVNQLPALACHEKLLEHSALRYREAQQLVGELHEEKLTGEDSTLILVGRGSSDPEARAEMFRFAQLRADELPGVAVEVCFYAMAEPKLEATLARVANSSARAVVVQPHLLFTGEVRQGIEREAVKYAKRSIGRQQWLFCDPLGAHRLLAEALWDLYLKAGQTPR